MESSQGIPISSSLTNDVSKNKQEISKPVPKVEEKKPKPGGLFTWVKNKLGVKDDHVHMEDKLSLYYDDKLKR